MNKKLLFAVGCVLVVCCCLSVFGGLGLVGYFESNGQCLYKGPFASVSSGACAVRTENTQQQESQQDVNNNSQQIEPEFDLRTYTGSQYSFMYPDDFTVDSSNPERLFVYAPNESDNLNISSQLLAIEVTQSNCEEYGLSTVDALLSYDALLENVSTTKIGNYNACRIDFSADYGLSTDRVLQTQYYVDLGSETYVFTLTINSEENNYSLLNNIINSVRFNQ